MSTIPNGENFDRSSEAFLAWLKQNAAAISSKIDLADLRGRSSGRGIVAKEAIDADEQLFSLPRSLILTVETSGLPIGMLDDLDDPWLSLILAMVFDYQQGTQSPWQAYFDVLPENFDTLMFWPTAELDLLKGSAVVNKIGKVGADKTFTGKLLPIIRKNADAFRATACSDEDLLTLCHRMGSTIMAYAFDLERPSTDRPDNEDDGWEEDSQTEDALPKGMVPLADMLNADADRNNSKLFYEDDRVVMKTIKPVNAGDELFNDYGPLPRADLLRRYGYVTEHYAKYDVVEVSVDLVKARILEQDMLVPKSLDERMDFADEQGIVDDAYDLVRPGNEEGQIPNELCVLLGLLVLSEAEFERMKKKDKLPKPELSSEAQALLYSILVHRYAMYPPENEPVAEDADAQKPNLVRRRLMARQVIQGEKEILREAANALSRDATSGKRAADTFEDDVELIRQPAKKR